jgi:hypothetical protein
MMMLKKMNRMKSCTVSCAFFSGEVAVCSEKEEE